MMKSFDQSVEINDDPKWSYIPDYPYRVLIIGGLGSGKTNVLLNLIKHQRPDIDNIYISKIHSNQSINCLLNEEKK